MKKVIVLTGASSGIGAATAKALSNSPHVLVMLARNEEKMKAIAAEIDCISLVIKTDVTKIEEVQEAIATVIEKFGGIDILINNAGITRDNLLMRMSEEQWDEVMNVNLKSVFNLTKASLRTFLKQKNGSIINMSSVVGVMGNAGQSNYAASKAGIVGFSKSIAKELGSRGIRCNVITPGFIETEMTAELGADALKKWTDGIPLKRGGTTEDVANACVFLGSDMSTYISGQVLSVCGGMLM